MSEQDTPQQLADGVHVLPLTFEIEPDNEMTLHPAAVETERGLVLVDTGFPPGIDQLEAHIDQLGFDWADVWAVVLTHQDPDHVSGLSVIIERTHPVVFAHRDCAPYVDGREQPVKMDGERYPPVGVEVELTEGVQFDTAAGPMEVIFTPGHAPGHMSLYFSDENLLISGDALHAPDGEIDGPRYPHEEEPAVESVEALGELDVEGTLTYHHGFVEHDIDAIADISPDVE